MQAHEVPATAYASALAPELVGPRKNHLEINQIVPCGTEIELVGSVRYTCMQASRRKEALTAYAYGVDFDSANGCFVAI